MEYLAGCAELFRDGYVDINQFTLTTNLAELEVTETTGQAGTSSNVGGRVSHGYRYPG